MNLLSNPFSLSNMPEDNDIRIALSKCIISSSGIRMITAKNGKEQSRDKNVSSSSMYLFGTIALAFAEIIKKGAPDKKPIIVLGTDSRPTGLILARAMNRILSAAGVSVRFLSIVPSPQIMAYAGQTKEIDGFAYITASHNPVGHNGFKGGFGDGCVFGGADSDEFNSLFKSLAENKDTPGRLVELSKSIKRKAIASIYEETDLRKNESAESYRAFTLRTITDFPKGPAQEALINQIRPEARKRRLGILADMNGSARCESIDRQIIENLGINFSAINAETGTIAHTIIPEDKALIPCKKELKRLLDSDSGWAIGYMPDNDGDRGNIVYYNELKKTVSSLPSQTLFALVCAAELSFLVYSGKLTYGENGKAEQKIAVVVNGPTSLRIERIGEFFDVRIFRSEVGEANVVQLADDLRNSGFTVRILGEGSNGGTIIFPSGVRDPLNTLGSLVKFLLLPESAEGESPFQIWCRKSGQKDKYLPEPTIAQIIDTLPKFTTTGVAEKRAIMEIQSPDHRMLKNRYEEIFLHEWEEKREYLKKKYDAFSWEEINYEGKEEKHGFGDEYRNAKGRGGFKILFKNKKGKKVAFIWMRNSGTEPVFRVLADIQGNSPSKEAWLLNWHRNMISRADGK